MSFEGEGVWDAKLVVVGGRGWDGVAGWGEDAVRDRNMGRVEGL